MTILYKTIYLIKFLFGLVMIFLWFFGTWNLISFLISYKDCIPAQVRFQFAGETYGGTGGSIYYKYGYLNNKEVRLDDAETLNNEISNVWLIQKSGHYNAYIRTSGETAKEFKFKKVFRFFKKLSIWISIFLSLHITTQILKKKVHLEEPLPRKPNLYND